MRFKTGLFSVMILLSVFAFAASLSAQQESDAFEMPETLMDVIDLPVCADDLLEASEVGENLPEGAESRTVLVFALDSMQESDLTTLMWLDSQAAIEEQASTLALTSLNAITAGDAELTAESGLYGWLVVYFDAEGSGVCRSTAYPAADVDGSLEMISLQDFIAQMVGGTTPDIAPDERCTFDTPQFCEAIFIGDDTDDVIEGSSGADLIQGAAGDDTISGNEGDDYIDGGDGDDVIYGGDGDDVIIGGSGGDNLHGGDGDDVIFGGSGDDVLHGNAGLDTLDGEEGLDTVRQD